MKGSKRHEKRRKREKYRVGVKGEKNSKVWKGEGEKERREGRKRQEKGIKR